MKLIHWTLIAFFLSLSGPLYAQEADTEETTTEEAAEETKDNADKAMTDLEKAEAAKKAAAKKKADDAKKAKKKAEGEDGEEKPAEEATAPVAEEVAAPVETAPAAATTETVTTADAEVKVEAEKEEDKKPKKPWGVSLSMGHSVGSGSFLANSYLRETRESATQSWGLSGRYSFKVLELPLSASASVSLSIPLVEPQGIDDRPVRFGNTSFGLSAGSVYKDEWSGINLSAGLGYSAPTAITNWYANKNYGSMSGRLGLSRSFGDFSMSLGMSMSHTLYASNVGQSLNTSGVSEFSNVANHCTTAIVGQGTAAAAGDDIQAAINGMNTVYQCEQGSARSFLSIGNNLGLSYKITDLISVSYSLGFSNSFKYAIVSEADQYTNPGSSVASPSMSLDERDSSDNTQWVDGGESGSTTNGAADTGVGLSQRFSSGLSISYGLSKGIEEWVELPFSLSLSASIATSHSAQKPNGDLFLPLFYNSFGDNQAANSYGSVSFGLSGSY